MQVRDIDLNKDSVVENTFRRKIKFGIHSTGVYDVTVLEGEYGKYYHVLLIGSGPGIMNLTNDEKDMFEDAIGERVNLPMFTGTGKTLAKVNW